ncbi:hypothetical protein [Streptomyces scabiei]|uniref:hypothetical protein n=1 Tax=Streptomyces scabiei TaxID=1930 RepID=UPI0011D20DDC|nr:MULTISPECIES: hypothetical protein [Streptomyces]MBP5867915.1 hypothetical protein [Streptomyces sp. LBUM 1485]MBP5916276.1 hypothetical protein [Streptomyces sp. LBUM 1486]MDX2540128.1 hypothetical protein [Streptomyces scabiei]MDX2802545.1 hypothetical protein [Streptomyces scabiei]MDX2856832.1 hypothetical protein [Streptomyces scabiei]
MKELEEIMKKQTTSEQILKEVIALIEETRARAKLSGKPFVLGLLFESSDGSLVKVLRQHEDELKKLGATLLEWRDDALRGRAQIAGEELLVSIQRA